MNKITGEMTILDIVSDWPQTVSVFKKYDKEANACICCEMFFSTLNEVAEHYSWNVDEMIRKLVQAC